MGRLLRLFALVILIAACSGPLPPIMAGTSHSINGDQSGNRLKLVIPPNQTVGLIDQKGTVWHLNVYRSEKGTTYVDMGTGHIAIIGYGCPTESGMPPPCTSEEYPDKTWKSVTEADGTTTVTLESRFRVLKPGNETTHLAVGPYQTVAALNPEGWMVFSYLFVNSVTGEMYMDLSAYRGNELDYNSIPCKSMAPTCISDTSIGGEDVRVTFYKNIRAATISAKHNWKLLE